jgi:hypothetical protein
MEVSDIGRLASEEVGKFGRMNSKEREVLRNIIFVYSWMRAAGRYSYRFPMAHPIQAAVGAHLGDVGEKWTEKQMGGIPSFLVGAIPVGRDSKGNPLLINPFTVNPMGTGLQEWSAVKGTIDQIRGKPFDKYSQQDIISGVATPVIQSLIEAHSGGKSIPDNLKQSLAWWRLQRDLRHPGGGNVYPTTRAEAIGHFMLGGFYPREADQAAITRSLLREKSGHPEALIPEQLKVYQKRTGGTLPQEFVKRYRDDLNMTSALKNFQHEYASKHGQSGFRNLPAQNRLEAAIDWLEKYSPMPEEAIVGLRTTADRIQSDAAANDMANRLFASTGIGRVKRRWDEIMRTSAQRTLTRKRQ